MSFSGSSGFYQGIELAVQASGAQAVADLEAHVQALKNQIAGLQAQMANGSAATVQTADDLAKLADQLQKAAAAAAAANRVMAGQPASLDATQRSARGAGQAFLELSRGIEDFATGGPLGALNNVPRVVGGIAQAFGATAPQIANAEAAASILATTLFLVYQNADKLSGILDAVFGGTKLIDNVESVTKALKELTDKPWQTDIETRDIDIAREKLDQLTRAKQAYDKLNDTTADQKVQAKAVHEAIVENAGPRGKAGLTDAVIASTTGDASAEVKAALKELEDTEQALKKAEAEGRGDDAAELEGRVWNLKKEGAVQRGIEYRNQRNAIEQQIGKAADGDEKSRAWLQDIIAKNPNHFAAQSMNVQGLYAGIAGASPAARQAALDKDAEQEQIFQRSSESGKELHDKLQGIRKDRKDRTTGAVSSLYPGFDDSLQKSMFDAIKGGATPEQAMGGQRDKLVPALRARSVGEDIVGDVANKILQKAADSAQNLINEGGQPRLDVKAATAKDKADAVRKQAVDKVDQGFTNRAIAMMARNDLGTTVDNGLGMPRGLPVAKSAKQERNFRASGQDYTLPPEVLNRRIEGMIGNDLRRSGGDPSLAPDIRKRAAEQYGTRKAEAMAQTALPDPSNIAAALGSQQGQAMAQLAQTQQALITVLGGVSAQIGRVQVQSAQNQTKLGQLSQDLGRGQVRGKSGSMTLR